MKVNKPLSTLFRLYLSLKKKFTDDIPLTEQQKYAVDICRKLISMEDTVLLFAPISGTKLIKNEEKQISAVLQERSITVVNKIYTYTTYIENDEQYYSLSSYFNLKMEKNTKKIEDEIGRTVTDSLKRIMNQVSL
jgi:gas vesicle protein